MKTVLQKKFILSRVTPVNFSENDSCHFQKDFEVEIKENHVRTFRNASIVQLFLFHKYCLQPAYCLTRKISLLTKLKAYVKSLIYKKKTIQNGLWVLDQWSSGYFHWFTEALPRIMSAREISVDYPVLLPNNYQNTEFISESLKDLDISVYYYDINKKLRITELLAPSHLQPAQFDPIYIRKCRDCFIKKNISEIPSKKIYISRKKANRRRVVNESELQEMLNSFGVDIVYMEDLTFSNQRALMEQTKMVISNHGAGLTNMIFMKEGSTVVELKANAEDINNCFFNLASALNHKYYYTINSGDSRSVQKSNIIVDLNKLKELLHSLA